MTHLPASPLAAHPSLRRRLYVAFWVIGLALGATQVAWATVGASPAALDAALAVYAFLGAALGFTAAANTDTAAADDEGDEPGA